MRLRVTPAAILGASRRSRSPPRSTQPSIEAPVEITGNILGFTAGMCEAQHYGSGPTTPLVWRYNILNGGSCGSTDKNAPHGYTNPDSDLHLLAGAAAIDAGDPASRPPADCPSVRRRLLRGRGREQPVQMVVSTGLVITFVATRSLV